jgi:multidrug efflux pump subunit AcrB
MGPYMRPIPIGASAAMAFSVLVAFIVIPWAAVRILSRHHALHHGEREDRMSRLHRRVMGALLHQAPIRWVFLASVVVLLVAAVSLFYFKVVTLKMLPFDNKSEFQGIVEMPNGTTWNRRNTSQRALPSKQ